MPAGNMNSWITRGRGFLLPVLFCLVSVAQAERLPLKTYTTADGLAHNEINKIVRDSRGFLWFCTADGLSRFDGYAFANYGTDQGLPHANVTDLWRQIAVNTGWRLTAASDRKSTRLK